MPKSSILNNIIPEHEFQEIVNILLESDEYYESLTTPLKTAQEVKEEHRQQLSERLQFKEFSDRMHESIQAMITKLPALISKDQWEALVQEFSHAGEQLHLNLQNSTSSVEDDEPLILQEKMGISNTNMGIIYALGRQLLEEKDYGQAVAVFTLLNYLNPLVFEYSLGAGISLYLNDQCEEALNTLAIAETLEPNKAAPLVYFALCQLKLNQHSELQHTLEQLKQVLDNSVEESNQWDAIYQSLSKESKI